MIEPRTRTPLITATFLGVLVTLLLVGVRWPELVAPGIPPATFRWPVGLVGLVSTAVLTRSAVRNTGKARLSWHVLSAAVALWTGQMLGALSGWDPILMWGVLRGCVAALGVLWLVLIPGMRRPARQWGLVLLDGWLVGGSVFIIGWVALERTGSLLNSVIGRPSLYWIGTDLAVASVTAGLAMRADRCRWPEASLMVLASLLLLTGDCTWALTGEPQFAAVQWMIMAAALATSSTGLHPLAPGPGSPPLSPLSTPGQLRWSQVAVVPGLVAAVCSPSDRIVVLASTSVVLALAAEIAMIARQNHELWDTLHTQARRLDQLINDSRDAILQIDTDGIVDFANGAAADVLGRPPRELLGRDLAAILHPDDVENLYREAAELTGDRTSVRVTSRIESAGGGWRSIEATVSLRSGDVAGLTLLARDVSDRMRLASELQHLACTDTLTGLSNRHAFLARVDERLATDAAAVLFVDLDGFKTVNDVLGHTAGDRLLKEAADALRAELGPGDIAARLGGDEFAVLVASPDRAAADALAARVADRMRRLPSDAAQRTSASIGVAVGRDQPAEDLLGDADLAMYEAKACGGGRRSVFEPEMRRRVTERARRRAALERACHGEGLRLDVQPIVALDREAWVGFEALVRWQDGPTLRPPDSFLPLAEETGLIVPLGEWVLRTALEWLGRWPDPTAGISVNVAARQVAEPGFGDLVVSSLRTSRIEPHRLTLEITEQTAVEDLQCAGAVLQPLRALGVHVSLDDFGTGFSSLGYLARLPVDELKIDRRFVAGLGLRAEDDALIRAVLSLAADLGLRTVAEGVETPDQVRLLAARGCPLGQGHLFLRPTPAGSLRPPAPRPVRDAGSPPDTPQDTERRQSVHQTCISPALARSVWT